MGPPAALTLIAVPGYRACVTEGLVAAPANPIRTRAEPRASAREVTRVIDAIFSGVQALAGCDRGLLDLILPSEDLAARMCFVPGAGPLAAALGRWINRRLDYPTDGAPWTVGYRADIYRERDAGGADHEFIDWQLLSELGTPPRARREEAIHLFSLMRLADGTGKLAVSRRRLEIADARELPDKWHDRYSLSARRIGDHRQEAQFVRFLRRSARLRALVGDTAPERIQLVRTDMDRPFQQPLLQQVWALSHNYYVLNEVTRDRMFIHFFDFWHAERPRLVDRLGRLLNPHELGHYEVSDFMPTARTPTFDPTLDTGLIPAAAMLPA